jgi:aspartate aminotransferase-like enzyme
MIKKQIFTPGPTEVPYQTLLEAAKPIIHHRKKDFKDIFSRAAENLKKVFQTQGEVFIFASSGTGAMEAGVANFTSRGDSALVIESGKFGQRWRELCETFEVNADVIECEWGDAVDPGQVQDRLSKNKDIKAVFATLVETALGCDVLKTDEWGVDVVVSGSQKALMTPPGLAFLCAGEKAKQVYGKNPRKSYYWDIKKASKNLSKLQTPYTPAVTLIRGLLESLNKINDEGIENVWARHERLARAARQGIKALDMELFAKSPANGLTAVKIPSPEKCGDKFVKHIEEKHGIVFAGGQEHLKGKIFRIAHMGYYDEYDVIKAVSAVELALKELGIRDRVSGEGVKAVLETFAG